MITRVATSGTEALSAGVGAVTHLTTSQIAGSTGYTSVFYSGGGGTTGGGVANKGKVVIGAVVMTCFDLFVAAPLNIAGIMAPPALPFVEAFDIFVALPVNLWCLDMMYSGTTGRHLWE